MTQAQQRGLEDVWPRLGLTIADGRQDLDALFGRQAPRVVEIGFGMGNSLIEQAETHPDTDFIGIEVHAPGVGKLLDEVDKRGLTNLRVYREDALAVLEQCLPEGSLTTLQLFFPDPWPKKKHHKRRIVQPAFVELIRTRLKPGGTFHMALGASIPESLGVNKSSLHWDMICDLRKGGKVFADGTLIQKDGKFLDKRFPQPPRSSARKRKR